VTSIKMGGVRLDYELSPRTRLMTKVAARISSSRWRRQQQPPGWHHSNSEVSREVLVQATQVLGSRTLNEIKGGMSSYLLDQQAVATGRAIGWRPASPRWPTDPDEGFLGGPEPELAAAPDSKSVECAR